MGVVLVVLGVMLLLMILACLGLRMYLRYLEYLDKLKETNERMLRQAIESCFDAIYLDAMCATLNHLGIIYISREPDEYGW